MVFLFLATTSLVALGIGSLGAGSAIFWSVLACIGGLIFLRQERVILVFFLFGVCGSSMWYIGNARYMQQLQSWQTLATLTENYTKKVHIEGTLEEVAYTSDFSSTYRLSIDTIDNHSTEKLPYKPALFIEVPKNLTLTAHDRIDFTTKVLPLLSFPFDGFERYVWKSAVYGKASVPSFQILSHGKPSLFEGIQSRSRDIIFRGFPRDVASIILGMTIGDTELLTRDVKNTFILSGMSHILVVSGSNIAFVIFFLLFFLKYGRPRTLGRMMSIVVFILLYGCLVGWDAPVVRAASMGIVAYSGMQYGKRVSSIALLFLIALILGVFNPLSLLYDAGFGLSFCATLGILLFHERISIGLQRYHIPRFFIPFFSITLGATLGSLPVTIFHFGTISIGGLLANILIAFVLSWILFMSVIYLIFAFLEIPGLYMLGLVIYLPAKFILGVALFFSRGLHIDIPPEHAIILSLTMIGGFTMLIFSRTYCDLTLKNQKGIPHQAEGLRQE